MYNYIDRNNCYNCS